MSYTRAQLQTGELVFLLTLTLRGLKYRFAESEQEVTDGAKTLRFTAGLESSPFEDRIAQPGQAIDPPGHQVDVQFKRDTAAGWAALAGGTADFGDATGELSLWLVGEEFSTRRILLSGPLSVSDYGALYEPATITLTEAPWESPLILLPPDEASVSSSTWPRAASSGFSIGDGIDGQYYPEIIGAPGDSRPRETTGSYPASPALLVEVDTATDDNSANNAILLIGRGVLGCVGTSNSVFLRNTTQNLSASFTPESAADELGSAVTILDVVNTAGGGIDITVGDSLWVSFTNPTNAGRIGDSGTTMRAAGDVIDWLLDESGARVDQQGFEHIRTWLAGFLLDFHLNEQVNPIDILLDDILPLLPVALKLSPRGLAFVPWRFNATPSDSVGDMDIDRISGSREGRVQRSDPADVINSMGLEYAPHGEQDLWLGRFAWTAALQNKGVEIQPNPYARASKTRYGSRQAGASQTAMVMDTATARAILDWQMRWLSSTRETARFLLTQEWQYLEVGDVVVVSEEEIGWDNRVSIVTSISRAPGQTLIEIVTVPDFLRDGPTL